MAQSLKSSCVYADHLVKVVEVCVCICLAGCMRPSRPGNRDAWLRNKLIFYTANFLI